MTLQLYREVLNSAFSNEQGKTDTIAVVELLFKKYALKN